MESPSPSEQPEASNCSSSNNNLTRSKPCREIYRPPNLRKGGPRNDEYSTKHTNKSAAPKFSSGHSHNESGAQKPKFNVNAKEFCYQPKVTRSLRLPLACHVQYDSSNTFQTIEQQLKAYREEDYMARSSAGLMQSKSLGNVLQQEQEAGPHFQSSLTLASPPAIKPVPGRARGERHPGVLTSTFLRNASLRTLQDAGEVVDNSCDRLKLKQSKSSGNVPAAAAGQQHKVRFQDSEENNDNDDEDEDESELVGNCLTSLKLKGDEQSAPILENHAQARKPVNPASAQQLQRSRTLASYLPWSENGGSSEPLISQLPGAVAGTGRVFAGNGNYFPATASAAINPWLQYFRLQQQQLHTQALASAARGFMATAPVAAPMGQFFTASVAVSQSQSHPNSSSSNMVKRSKSFHSASPSQSRLNSNSKPAVPPMCPSILDFQITKWPKNAQEAITTVVTGVERNVTARHKIEMVAHVFEALFNCKDPGHGGQGQRARSNSRELILPAVHVFMYLLIKEQQNLTIAECLMNTCFETFQLLAQKCKELQGRAAWNSDNQRLSNTWINFLKFLSKLYSQIKVLRRQPLPGPVNTRTIHEMSARILSLTCDVCHATLSSSSGHILLMTPETADHLFMMMTSIGQDMETAYPMKMKQILAAVRDVLLGVNVGSFHVHGHAENGNGQPKSPPVHQNNRLSPCIQKTLMQLIELHAANWNLPASAVRYYYNNSNDTK